MTAKYGSGGSSGAQGKLVVGHSEDEGSDEGWGLTGGEGEEEGQGAGRKRGPGKDKEVKGGKGAKGRKGGEQCSVRACVFWSWVEGLRAQKGTSGVSRAVQFQGWGKEEGQGAGRKRGPGKDKEVKGGKGAKGRKGGEQCLVLLLGGGGNLMSQHTSFAKPGASRAPC
jgi:hypothetical protein